MFRLAHKEFLLLYLLLAVISLFFLIMMWWKRKSLKKFGDIQLIQSLFPDASDAKVIGKFILFIIGFSFLLFAVCGPQLGSKLEEVKRKGADIVIALDVSNSMKAEDIKPNRLERAKQAISHMIDKLEGDRIGIVVFAGAAYTQLPITTDYGAAKLFLSTVDNDIVPAQGTAIGAAIDLAASSFGDSTKHHNAIVVITDGENHEDDAVDAAKKAAEKGIIVHTIGMGSPQGSPIPIYHNGQRVGFKEDENGVTVISKLDENALAEIAMAGKGKFVRATNSDDGLRIILSEINALDKKEFKSKMFTDYEDQFQYFLIAALLFFLLEFALSETKSKWIEKLNMFGEVKK